MNESVPSGSAVAGGRKVGRKPAFTADDVVAAAVAEGIDRFKLSAVADRLGVVTTAIYRLFPSRDDLVLACLDRAGSTIALPEPGMHWRDTLKLWGDQCWQVCEEFPGLARVLYSNPIAPTRIEHVFDAYSDNLCTQGRTAGQAMFALDFVGDTVVASHLGVESMRSVREDGRNGLDAVKDAVGDADVFYSPADSWTGRTMADKKVDFIISGLEQNWPEFY
ncbi:MAG: TetR/AcrR family transcriptional regulator [Gordonia sp. (in: high G+C Gram-positive bacteria)]|uniref:TetR/AcrR family transcriptional regulator n=1 Tax=Gordonia sp. (in: high G+C Gram-positive bacteria) TaxID=84139 RepID=UPI0039E4B7C8